MGSPSEPQCKAVSPWRGLLITAARSSQRLLRSPYGEVNHIVTLDNQGFSGQALLYTWYRKVIAESNRITRYMVATGEQEPANIRQKVLPHGSLVISDLTLHNTDTYHVVVVYPGNSLMVGQGHLQVYERTTKPHLMANRTIIIENSTLAFTCGTKQDGENIKWFFNKKPLIFNEKMKLSMKNRTLTILSVKRKDTGSYQCEIRNPISFNSSDPFILTVNYGPDNIMLVPNPKKEETEVKFQDPLMLKCHAESHPPAQYIWQFKDKKIPVFSHNTNIIKTVTWANSGKYTCLAKNNVTKLSVSKSITIKVIAQSMEGSSSSLSGGVIIGIMIGFLAGIILIATVIYIHFRKTRRISKPQLSENH